VSQFDHRDGFYVGNDLSFDPDQYWAKYVLEQHMKWDSTHRSPFISVTDSWDKACDHCEQRITWGRSPSIATIDVRALQREGVRFWRMQTLARRVGANIPQVAWNPYEWLCLHGIPEEAVLDMEEY
jgi:hypothetical protein